MAREKMHRGLGRTSSDTQKNSVRGRDTSTRKFNGKNSLRTALEDSEEPSITWRNFNRRQICEHLRKSEVGLLAQVELAVLIQRTGSRCAFLTLLSLEPENSLRIVSLPLQCPDNTNFSGSGSQVNMDSLRLFYTPPINPLKVIQPKEQQGSPLAGSYCGKSFTNRSFAGSNVRHQSRNKTLAYEATKWNELSRESCQKSLTCSASSSMIENGSNAINLSDTGSGGEKVDNVKRNSRKKSRKKGRQGKKHSSASSSTEADVLSVECANGSSAPETCGNNDGSGSVSSSTAPEVSLSGVKNESPKPCISYHDELEVDIPSVGNLGHQSVHKDAEFSIFDGVGRIPRTQLSDCNDLYTKGYSDMHNSFVLDSISVGSNCDDNTIDGHDEKHAEKDIHGVDFSEPSGFSSRMGSCQSMSNDVVDTYDNTEGMRHGIQDCNSKDMQSVVPSKRSKQHKIEQRSSNFFKFGSTGNLHLRSGKENNHSVWQKVQKNDDNDCKCELKKESSVYSQNDPTLTEAPLAKRSCTSVNVNVFSKREDKIQQKDMVSKELKIKGGLASKQVFYARKGGHANFPGSDGCLKSGVEQNDMSDVLSQVKDNKGSSLVSRSCSQRSCPRVGFQSSKEGSMTSESVRSMQLCPNEVDRLEGVHNSFSGMKTQISGNRDTAMQKISDSLGESNLLQVQSPPIYLPHLLCKAGIQAQKETLLAESRRENPSSGSLKHKWVPIELKDPVPSSTNSSSHEHSDEPAAKRWTPKDTAKGNTQNISSEAVVCLGQSSGDVTCSANKTEDMLPKLGYQDASTIDALKDKLSAAKCMNFESKDLNADSNRILEAVNNACRAQLASEAVQMVTGGPIAEFERLLYYSSPVVHESPKFIRCQTCSRNQVGGLPVCRHETTNITLGCLWQWYQISGSYGLEIRAEEFGNSKGLGADRFAFHAYFVPYLSAVQLFRSCRSDSVDTSTWACSTEVLVEKSKKTSNLGHLPIFSILFPRPRKEDAITPPLVNEPCILEQSSAPAKDVPIQLTDTTGSSDVELLFEYFESEQPQLRRPLYDKIKELVRGDRPSDSNVYGDPTNLDSINLNDLHSRSWYSVAWYPIYRIPHGNLRAAFLTYHSLGHLVRRSANFESPSADECIVSPVVGLQSYNAQDECWFQPRQSALRQTTVTPGPSLNSYRGVLEERLRTLEETASLMARAVVKKGSMTSVNRHPDYEFFLSRRR